MPVAEWIGVLTVNSLAWWLCLTWEGSNPRLGIWFSYQLRLPITAMLPDFLHAINMNLICNETVCCLNETLSTDLIQATMFNGTQPMLCYRFSRRLRRMQTSVTCEWRRIKAISMRTARRLRPITARYRSWSPITQGPATLWWPRRNPHHRLKRLNMPTKPWCNIPLPKARTTRMPQQEGGYDPWGSTTRL